MGDTWCMKNLLLLMFLGKEFGATDCINPLDYDRPIHEVDAINLKSFA